MVDVKQNAAVWNWLETHTGTRWMLYRDGKHTATIDKSRNGKYKIRGLAHVYDSLSDAKNAANKNFVIKRNPSTGGVKIVYNKLLGGWYVVRGLHHTPLSGRFNTKAEAQAWLQKRAKNPSTKAKAAVALRNKIKRTTYGLPDDQLTAAEKKLVKELPQHFENDSGYIKLVRGRRNASRTVLEMVKLRREKERYQKIMDYVSETGKGKFKDLPRIAKALNLDWIKVQGEINKRQGEWLRRVMADKKNESPITEFKNHQKQKLHKLSEMFQGEASGTQKRVMESDLAPQAHKYRLGHLVLMKIKRPGQTKSENIEFDGESYLAGDTRNNLWVVGKDARVENLPLPKKGELRFIGKLLQIDYVTAKKHIEGGKLVRFWHPLGEVDKDYPSLWVDHDGFPIIIGGGYDVWEVGIVN